jgi:hypothetical protein
MSTSWFCSPGTSGLPKDLATAAGLKDKTVLECDYDENVTNLYSAIESEAWAPVLQFLETGQWEHMFLKDPQPPDRQARTWVTRFNPDGSVRWSQLPLHAALIFGAPKKVIVKLIDMYPLGVRCTDDQQMLPFHLAIKFGSDDIIMFILLEKFPAALSTKDVRGRVPTDIEGPDKMKDRMQILRKIVTVTTDTVRESQGKYYQQKMKDLKDDLAVQAKRTVELENEKKALEMKLKQNMNDFAELQEDFDAFKEAMLHSKAGQNGQYQHHDVPSSPSVKSPMPPMEQQQQQQQQQQTHHLPRRPPPVTASRQMHRDMVLKPSTSVDSSTTAGSRSRLMQSPRSFVFGGRSKDYSGTIITATEQEHGRGQGVRPSSVDSSKRESSWKRGKSTTSTATDNYNADSVSSHTTNTATAPSNQKRLEKQRRKEKKDKKKYMWSKSNQRGSGWVRAKAAAIDGGKKGHRKPPRPGDYNDGNGDGSYDVGRNDVNEQRETSLAAQQRVADEDDNDQEMIVSSSPYNHPHKTGTGQHIPIPHPGTRQRLPLAGFFRGFDNEDQ